MAAPVDAARATTDGSTSTTAQTMNLPGGGVAGDIYVAIIRTPTAVSSIGVAGFTALSELRGADASDDNQQLFVRAADGTEGATVNVTLGTAARMAALCYLVTGGDTVSIFTETGSAFESLASGTSATPDSPNYAPYGGTTTFDQHDTLWLSLGGIEGAPTITTGPSGYSNSTIIANTGTTGNGQCAVYGASKQATAATSENPGSWTLSASNDWMAWTVAVYTAAPHVYVSQDPAEAAVLPTSAAARTSQAAVEAIVIPDAPMMRASQVAVEAVIDLAGQQMRVSQVAVEAILENLAAVPTFQAIIFN